MMWWPISNESMKNRECPDTIDSRGTEKGYELWPPSMSYTALLDANVLYPAPVRDLLLQLAVTDLYKARWTADIHREWIENLLANEPNLDRARLERTRDLMDSNTRDALVTGYETLIPSLQLPDPHDRHVLAAAIVGRCDVIVTANLKDFPDAALAPFGVERSEEHTSELQSLAYLVCR